MKDPVIVTGAAGFIGFHLCARLAAEGFRVAGFDNFNSYYDPGLKEARIAELQKHHPGVSIRRLDLTDAAGMEALFSETRARVVFHLAAQAGVRYSLENPRAYIDSNLLGFSNILEACRRHDIQHLVYASSSSVYGANRKMPFSEHHGVAHPVSLYGATKKANELMAHSYSHVFGLPTTGLRFFTVYGPWGRPDMAYYSFTRAILAGEPIRVFNHGKMKRDFTYIDDIIEGLVRVADCAPSPNPGWDADRADPAISSAPYRIFNIGNHDPVELMEFIAVLESALGRKARLQLEPMQDGDVVATYADVSELGALTGFAPATPLASGMERFVSWFRRYHT
ncbi:MAG: NAD-dependent epimerase [Leptospiraceae bacterium]|nr:NAD-dependent epimerase [Leptospiraceae bacterium]